MPRDIYSNTVQFVISTNKENSLQRRITSPFISEIFAVKETRVTEGLSSKYLSAMCSVVFATSSLNDGMGFTDVSWKVN